MSGCLQALLAGVGAGGTVTISNVNWGASDPSSAVSAYFLEADGDIARLTNVGPPVDQADWIVPRSAAPGTYEARMTMTSGTNFSGTLGSYVAISGGGATWGQARVVASGAGTTTGTGTLDVRGASGGPILASATITLSATIA